jgi:tetratricopeptide (TPR) repeat protein
LLTLRSVARTYEEAKEYNQAIAGWRRVLSESPDDPEALAGIRGAERQRDKAVSEHLEKARRFLARNDIPAAVPEITLVLSLDRQNEEARKMLRQVDGKMLISQNYLQGLESYQAGDYARAVRFFEAVRAIDPSYRDTARLYSDARSHLTPLEAMPSDVAAHYATGVNHFIRGDYAAAIVAWEKVLEKSPGHYLVLRNIAQARERMKGGVVLTPTPVSGGVR